MPTTTYALLNIIDGAGEERIVRTEYNLGDNSYAFHEVIEVNGLAVSEGNPLPVSAVISGTSVNSDGGFEVHVNSPIDIINPPPTTFFTETETPLLASATFLSSTPRVLPTATTARYFYASVYSDQASATNGFQILGYNGSTYLPIAVITTTGGIPTILQVPLIYEQFLIKFINNSIAQGTLWIQSGFAN